ncbi:MAG: hypothetical protein Kow006_31630 [Gammaproteobacteria bacterium]
MSLTKHAEKRLQDRGVPEAAIELLHLYGDALPQKGGTVLLRLNRRQRKRAEHDLLRLLEYVRRDRSPYCVIEGEQVITVAHEFKRLRSKVNN